MEKDDLIKISSWCLIFIAGMFGALAVVSLFWDAWLLTTLNALMSLILVGYYATLHLFLIVEGLQK